MKVTITMDFNSLIELIAYLKFHEGEIARGENDYGDLQTLFTELTGELPVD